MSYVYLLLICKMFLTYHNLPFHLKLVQLFHLFMWPTYWRKKYTTVSSNCGLSNAKMLVISNEKSETSASPQISIYWSSSTSNTICIASCPAPLAMFDRVLGHQ